mmetsp:Transcript_28692/g.42496  ORF Transcript_28692/g.42496 Transcript_28692/m.42496 type:complete len:117 (+) Transcript_28692:459-809(+)
MSEEDTGTEKMRELEGALYHQIYIDISRIRDTAGDPGYTANQIHHTPVGNHLQEAADALNDLAEGTEEDCVTVATLTATNVNLTSSDANLNQQLANLSATVNAKDSDITRLNENIQ